jgi:hypothetical protein
MCSDISPDAGVKHYLVQPTDTAGAKKTLPDFVMSCPQFAYILQLATDSGGPLTFRKCLKGAVLEPLLSKRDAPQPGMGYDPLN